MMVGMEDRFTAAISRAEVRPAKGGGPPPTLIMGVGGALEKVGPEHGMRGEATLCGLPKDEVHLMRHYWSPNRADACRACAAALA